MKELSIEEKSKAYDKAIKEASIAYKDEDKHLKATLERIFPELKESEDEKIRKWLIAQLKLKSDVNNPRDLELMILKSIAWLEKQGEKDKLIRELGEYKVKYIQETLGKALTMNNKDDERVRKTTIAFLKDFADKGYENAVECIDWLEKQKYALKSFKDEDVRKFMQYIEKQAKAYEFNLPNRSYDIFAFAKDILIWLEKKGEKPQGKSALEAIKEEKVDNQNCVKPADKVEPEFKVSDWLTENHPNNYARFMQILEIVNVQGKNRYRISRDLHNDEDITECSFIEDKWHPFNIQDAKDGDVLSFYGEYKDNKMVQVGIIEKYVGKHGGCSNSFKIHVGVNWENNLQIGKYMGCSDTRPATKEQRDTLFAKMREAGYEWDAEKKELKKIEDEPENYK